MKVNMDHLRRQLTDTYNALFQQLASTPLRDDEHPYCHDLSGELTIDRTP